MKFLSIFYRYFNKNQSIGLNLIQFSKPAQHSSRKNIQYLTTGAVALTLFYNFYIKRKPGLTISELVNEIQNLTSKDRFLLHAREKNKKVEEDSSVEFDTQTEVNFFSEKDCLFSILFFIF
jgi:hypothetical protein